MGRKRLMTILAGVVAAVGLHVGPALALDASLDGLGDVTLETSDGLTLEADLDAGTDDLKLTPKVEAELSSEPKLEVEDGAKVGDTEVDLGEATEPVTDAVEAPAPSPAPSPSEPSDDTETSSTSKERSSSDGDAPAHAPDHEVQMASTSSSFASPERAAQLEAFRALRDADRGAFGFSGDLGGSVLPGVQLAPRSGVDGDAFAAPDVAPGVEVAAPSVANEQPRSAQLATAPFSGILPEVPIALQLLAGTLVAGTALAWHLARRELAAAPVVERVGR
jgi:hypothetical protein